MEYRLVTEKELRRLLYAYNKMIALESGGVDNWDWYGASIGDYIDEWVREKDFDLDEDWGLDDIVEDDIQSYPIHIM